MDYLKILRENPDLAEEFDSLFDFFLLDELSPRDDAEGRDRKSTRLNSSHSGESRMPSSA